MKKTINSLLFLYYLVAGSSGSGASPKQAANTTSDGAAPLDRTADEALSTFSELDRHDDLRLRIVARTAPAT